MITRYIKSPEEIIAAIRAGNNPQDNGPVVVMLVMMVNGVIITGSYYDIRGNEKPDITSMDEDTLAPLVERLLNMGIPFVVQIGIDEEDGYTLKWQSSSEPSQEEIERLLAEVHQI